MDSFLSKQIYPLPGAVHDSERLTLAGLAVRNKTNCKMIIWNKLTLHIA